MIDAYEIGIQLLLQDDVSAGLTIINRGLADVDRAIAATSANLAGLGREAERITRAVSAAAGSKVPPQIPITDAGSATHAGDAATSPAKGQEPPDPTLPLARSNERGSELPASPSKLSGIKDPQSPSPSSIPSVIERSEEASSPPKAVESNVAAPVKRESVPADKPDERPLTGRLAEVALSPVSSKQPGTRDVGMAAAASKQGPTAPRAMLSLTAAIKNAREQYSSPAKANSQVSAHLAERFKSGLERAPAAPSSAVDRAPPQTSSSRLSERAAAPQSPGRDRMEGGGGAVMLDGRLVGQWLSEHMGREASRPPGGTSFFDARQTPAWNASGAL